MRKREKLTKNLEELQHKTKVVTTQGEFKGHTRKIRALFNRQSKTGSFRTNQVDRELSSKMSAGLPNQKTNTSYGEVYQIKEQVYA